MDRPRIFIGSSSEQRKRAEKLADLLRPDHDVKGWWESFPASLSYLASLVDAAKKADFAVFFFAPDDQTQSRSVSEASARDNVVFEAGLFAGILEVKRTFILHGKAVKLPSDLDGLNCIPYNPRASIAKEMTAAAETVKNRAGALKPRQADDPIGPLRGLWWQFSFGTEETERASVSFLKIVKDEGGAYRLSGRSWAANGARLANFESQASSSKPELPGLFYYWEGHWPHEKGNPSFVGTGEIRIESENRVVGHYTTRSETNLQLKEKKSTQYVRARPEDELVLDVGDAAQRAALIQQRLKDREELANH